MKSVQSTEAENVWFANNVNERQRLVRFFLIFSRMGD